MMRGQANENILTLMASIEGLHTQATNSDIRQTRIKTEMPSRQWTLTSRPWLTMRLFISTQYLLASQQGRDRDRDTSLLHPGIGHLLQQG